MNSKIYRVKSLPLFAVLLGLSFWGLCASRALAQETPILISHPESTRALAFEAVTQQREPFPLQASVRFGGDASTRIIVFSKNIQLQAGETAAAVAAHIEDTNGPRAVAVEYVGILPEYSWATAIILRLPADIGDAGDVLIGVRYRGQDSNRVRFGIGHTGGGAA